VADLIIAAEQRADALQQVQMLISLLASLFCGLFVLAMHWVSVLASLFCCLSVLAMHWVSVLASLFCCLFVLVLHWVSVPASLFCCLFVLALHWVSVHMQLAGQQTSRCQSPLKPIRKTMASKNTLAGEGK